MHREDFPMLTSNIIYLDNGATTFKPKCVIDAITEYYTEYTANAHRGDYANSLKVDMAYEGARNTVKEFINAKEREEIIFTSGSTETLNMVATGFFGNLLESGDEILITKSEHASNVLPWFRLANELGAVIKYIPLDNNHYVTIENVKKSITPKTKVIALAQITNVIGDERPIKEIVKIAHQNNIFVVVDAAQSAPHLKIDVQDMNPDFLAFSGHKMCGPTGIGVLYGKKELLENLEPINLGGGMNESFDSPNAIYLKSLPTRLEAGTPTSSFKILAQWLPALTQILYLSK
jgi:cysteine desulfurase/selenocysteine lyase